MKVYRIIWVLLWVWVHPAAAQRLSALAPMPDWSQLERFQETITSAEFTRLLNEVYAPNDAAAGLIEIHPGRAIIRKNLEPGDVWELRFAAQPNEPKPVQRFWRRASELPSAPKAKPLLGLKIAIDPGHLGGSWAHMEERWFQIGDSAPVAEGDMTLLVAQRLAPVLETLGATVFLVRNSAEPVTAARPPQLLQPARDELARFGILNPPEAYASMEDPARGTSVQSQSELLFYRVSEIRARAERVNGSLHPDLTLCLHFNAEAWGDPLKPALVAGNHFHLLLNGCYSGVELRNDDLRFDMLQRLLEGCFAEESAAAVPVATVMAARTGLPPYEYPADNAKRVTTSPYVWARNLLANRIYRTPVLFFEPYVMNNAEVWERVQAGDYDGEKQVAGALRKSLYVEYAQAVAEGLAAYYQAARPH